MKTSFKTKLRRLAIIIPGLCFCYLLFGQYYCFAEVREQGLTDAQLNKFSASNIMFYNPGECMNKVESNIISTACFKVSSDQDGMWYSEGCLNTGACTSDGVKYYAQGDPPGTDGGLVVTKNNPWLYSDTLVDDDFGGMQYIYAENYDWDYNGAYTVGTKNNNHSTRKYYWIALPNEAYTNGFGDTYVATFENISEPVYFIVFDAHACEHQKASYCSQANADPDAVAIGYDFIGALTDTGSPTEAANKAGKLTSFCRINGTGEVTVTQNGSASAGRESDDSKDNDSKSEKDSDSKDAKASTSAAKKKTDTKTKKKTDTKTNEKTEKDSENSSSKLIGNVHEASDSVSCAKGTTDLGVTEEAYYDGNQITIRLCSIPNISSTSETDTDGHIHVNSRVSGSYYALGEKYKELYGSELSASQSFRTMKQQKYFWDCYQSKTCNDGNLAAEPGHSNHQLGTAVDFVMDGSGWGDTGISGFFNKYLEQYDLVRGVSNEDWHVSHGKDEGSGTTDADCTSHEGKYPQYYQGNYEESDHENSSENWTTIPYGQGTVASSGCGPTSMAMLATAVTGRDIYPQDVINLTKSTGSYTTIGDPYSKLDSIVAKEYGFEVIAETYTSKDDAKTKIRDYLNKGYMIHLSGEGAHNGFSNKHTDGHYVGIFKIDSNDNVWVANSNSVGNSTVPLQDIIDAIHGGDFGAIKGSGGSGNSCFNYCSGDGSGGNNTLDEGGLTIEQAKTFMMNYGANNGNSTSDTLGAYWDLCNGSGSNCVSFSVFFMKKFTGISAPSDNMWGNGVEIVSNLKKRDAEATYGSSPKVFSVLSTPSSSSFGHTAVVLGHHDGKWVVGHASCSYTGAGKGNGGNGELNGAGDSKGGGSGFIAIENTDDPTKWQWVQSGVEFAYPKSVDTEKIKKYLDNGQ